MAIWGVTAGKALCGIRVVREESGDVPGWGARLSGGWLPRARSWYPLGWILLVLVYLSPLWDRRLQSWADKVARTLVVNSRRPSTS